jgi:lipopolysaccharide export LptBFGC system permease protein LptF
MHTITSFMNKSRGFLVTRKRWGWGLRINWQHRHALPFALVQTLLLAMPVWAIRSGRVSEAVFAASLFGIIASLVVVWVGLSQMET